MEEHRHLPEVSRLSVVAACIMLAYALIPFVRVPQNQFSYQLPGILLEFNLSYATLVSFLVAAMAAAGTDWLVRAHPHLGSQRTVVHWFTPALTAWALSVPLGTLEMGLGWWAVFAFGSLLLVLVLIAEYIAVDAFDIRYALASVGLTAVTLALYLILAIAVRAAGLRLYVILLTLAPTVGLLSLRTLHLRLGGKWYIQWAIGIGLVIAQLAVGLHYWPLTPLKYGLFVTGTAYGLTSLAGAIEEKQIGRSLWLEPLTMTAIFWLLALLIRGQ
jgi:Protein of unknown function (DUF5656)